MGNAIRILTITILLSGIPRAAVAQPPQPGTYDVLGGRSSLSGDGSPGHRLNVASWDGSLLGTQWKIICTRISNVTVLFEDPGVKRVSRIYYEGGYIWLDGGGPWAGGDPFYIGIMSHGMFVIRTETLTEPYESVEELGTYQIYFDSYYGPHCAWLTASDGRLVGDTNAGLKPSDYPEFLDSGCQPTEATGRWSTFGVVRIDFPGACILPVEEQTWGAIKNRYLD